MIKVSLSQISWPALKSPLQSYIEIAGVEVEHLQLDLAKFPAVGRLPFVVRGAAADAVAVLLPTWRAPLVVRLSGVRLELRQRNMPQVALYVNKIDMFEVTKLTPRA